MQNAEVIVRLEDRRAYLATLIATRDSLQLQIAKTQDEIRDLQRQ